PENIQIVGEGDLLQAEGGYPPQALGQDAGAGGQHQQRDGCQGQQEEKNGPRFSHGAPLRERERGAPNGRALRSLVSRYIGPPPRPGRLPRSAAPGPTASPVGEG